MEPISDKTEQQNLTSFAIKIYFFSSYIRFPSTNTHKNTTSKKWDFFERKQWIGETIQAIVTFAIYEWRFSY